MADPRPPPSMPPTPQPGVGGQPPLVPYTVPLAPRYNALLTAALSGPSAVQLRGANLCDVIHIHSFFPEWKRPLRPCAAPQHARHASNRHAGLTDAIHPSWSRTMRVLSCTYTILNRCMVSRSFSGPGQHEPLRGDVAGFIHHFPLCILWFLDLTADMFFLSLFACDPPRSAGAAAPGAPAVGLGYVRTPYAERCTR